MKAGWFICAGPKWSGRRALNVFENLVAENEALIEEVHRFRTDMTYVESVARNELNLIRENEVIYRFGKGKTGN